MNLAIVKPYAGEKAQLSGNLCQARSGLRRQGATAWAGYGLLSRVLPAGYAGAALATLGAICAAVAVYAVLVIALRMITRRT